MGAALVCLVIVLAFMCGRLQVDVTRIKRNMEKLALDFAEFRAVERAFASVSSPSASGSEED